MRTYQTGEDAAEGKTAKSRKRQRGCDGPGMDEEEVQRNMKRPKAAIEEMLGDEAMSEAFEIEPTK